MCLLAGFSLLFLGAAVWNGFRGDADNAFFGLIIGGVLGAFAYLVANEETETEEFLVFLLENEETLKGEGSILYKQSKISSHTEVTHFYICLSCLIFTSTLPSRFYVRGQRNLFGIGLIYSLASFVFGWWGFPSGPIETIQSLYRNMRGGNKKTVAQLLTEIERPETAPSNS